MNRGITCLGLWICLSCNNSSSRMDNSTIPSTADTVVKATIQLIACYERSNGQDTVRLQFENSNGSITGKLFYKLYQKDVNDGTITGTMEGDTLIARYRFGSEGKISERQVAFLKNGNQLIEGFGPVKEENGQFVFTNTDSLKFDTAYSLKPVPCLK